MKNKAISVFCSSSNDASDVFKENARILGEEIAKRQYQLIFGGSGMGLMRILADAALDNGADVLGVMPEFMKEVEWNYDRLQSSQMVWTDSMASRKDILIGKADAIVVMPGAVGTLEEFAEAISLKRLGRFFAPIIFFNINGFYTPLIEWLELTISENLMRDNHLKMWSVAHSVDEIFDCIENEEAWPSDAVTFAAR